MFFWLPGSFLGVSKSPLFEFSSMSIGPKPGFTNGRSISFLLILKPMSIGLFRSIVTPINSKPRGIS